MASIGGWIRSLSLWRIQGKHKMYMNVPQRFEKWYGRGVVLLVLNVIYTRCFKVLGIVVVSMFEAKLQKI